MAGWSLWGKTAWGMVLVACLFASPGAASVYGSTEPAAQIWKVGQRQWTIAEEERYGKWVEANVDEDFFIRHKLPVDCADAVYAIRWIYARIAGLPAAATTVDGRLIGHWSEDWGRLPTHARWDRDRRFRAALRFVFSKTWTATLTADVYPIRIAPDSVTAGTVFFADSHAGIVSHLVRDGSTAHPIQTLEATSPFHIQKLRPRDFHLPDPDPQARSGLVKFRWPIRKSGRWEYLPLREQPDYSEEQYAREFKNEGGHYLAAVARRIDPTAYDPRDRIDRILSSLIRRLEERIPIVLEGSRRCRRGRCPEGTGAWDAYSTPGRDESLLATVSYLEAIMKQSGIARESVLERTDHILLGIAPGRLISVRQVLENVRWLASDPEATVAARWGLEKCRMIAERIQSARDSMAFITRTYGTTDPRFAERSLWVQQSIEREMTEEARASGCAAGEPAPWQDVSGHAGECSSKVNPDGR